jgi:hypothetical protein
MAQETLAFLAEQSALAEKQAAYEAGQADAQALIDHTIFEAGKRQAEEKQAQDMFFKLGQATADASMSDLMGGDAGGAGAADAGGVPPDAGGDMGGELTIEDLAAALQSLVDDGTLQPEEAQQIMEAIALGVHDEGAEPAAGADAGGVPPADAAGADVGGGEPPADDAANKEGAAEAKPAAPATKAAALLDVIRQLQSARK